MAVDTMTALPSTLSPPRSYNSMRWLGPRAEMIDQSLVVWRMCEDIEALFELDAELSVEALVALGWPRDLVARHITLASQHCAARIAARLQRRRQAAPFTLPPPDGERERLSGPSPDPLAEFDAFDRSVGPAVLAEARALLFHLVAGALFGAILGAAFVSLFGVFK